ncbi:MAG: hypothetical protein ACXADY_04520 [Candidatus Hodarchaeales archaeon]|jgi:hypothetical protein
MTEATETYPHFSDFPKDTEELISSIVNELGIKPTIIKVQSIITLAIAITREKEAGTRSFLVFDDQSRQELILSNPPTASEIAFVIWLINQDHFSYELLCQRCGRIVQLRKGQGISRRICGLCTGLYG